MKHTLKELLTYTQNDLLPILDKTMTEYDYELVMSVEKGGVLYQHKQKDSSVCLVAHLDTINTHRGRTPSLADIEETEEYIKLSANAHAKVACLGADDRVGIWNILKAIEDDFKGYVAFFLDEEIGCVGSSAFLSELNHQVKSLKDFGIKSLVQIDRGQHEGEWNEVVSYECTYTDEFRQAIADCGYAWAVGSFTDVATFGETFNLPILNVSASYQYEHTRNEFINKVALANNYKALWNVIRLFEDITEDNYNYYNYLDCLDYYYYFDKELDERYDEMLDEYYDEELDYYYHYDEELDKYYYDDYLD